MLGIDVPLWIIISSSVAALPAILYARTQLQYWRHKRKAESLGARLAPMVPHRWPGGIDLIVALIDVFKIGYIGKSDGLGLPGCVFAWGSDGATLGDVMCDWLAEEGQTIDMRTLWKSHVGLSAAPMGQRR